MSLCGKKPFDGKTILVMGGTWQQVKFVEAAHDLGARVLVADYLENSPAKTIADKSFLLDIKDVDSIVSMCKLEGVDGVVSGYIDPCQRPYQEVCEKLGLPCYGTRDQFFRMTDKVEFKRMCLEHGVDVIPGYSQDDIDAKCVEFPVFVKPVDSRGSRGQSVCWSYEELDAALANARGESSNGEAIVEKYMKGAHEFQVTYFFINGRPYIVRTADSYTGTEANGLEKVVLGAFSPSVFAESYMNNAHAKVVGMLLGMGIENGPAFMQGFEDKGRFRFFDPGLRFPGVNYEQILKRLLGVDLAKAMVEFSLTGRMPAIEGIENAANLGGACSAVLFPTVAPGCVDNLGCLDDISAMEGVVSCLPRVSAGDRIGMTADVNQRLAEIDVVADRRDELLRRVSEINSALDVERKDGTPLVLEVVDPLKVKARMTSAADRGMRR